MGEGGSILAKKYGMQITTNNEDIWFAWFLFSEKALEWYNAMMGIKTFVVPPTHKKPFVKTRKLATDMRLFHLAKLCSTF